jgi:succinate dehydrogenase / fumarate reductase, membrane anchor subunit
MVNPLSSVKIATRGAGQGVRYWILQRATSLFMTLYLLFLLGFFLYHPHLQYAQWKQLFLGKSMRIGSTLFLISLCWHSWIGLWGVVTDYIKSLTRRLLVLSSIFILCLTYFIWGIMIVWSV